LRARRLGQKAGRGWYAYPDGKRTIDPQVTAIIEASRAVKGITFRSFSGDEILQRMLRATDEGKRAASRGDCCTARRHRPGNDQRLRIPGS
jgi:3-hydroxyacyl-CoA dehydrogenase